jgi:hypothetical protein
MNKGSCLSPERKLVERQVPSLHGKGAERRRRCGGLQSGSVTEVKSEEKKGYQRDTMERCMWSGARRRSRGAQFAPRLLSALR